MIFFYPAYNIRDESKIRLDNARQYGNEFKVQDAVVSRKYGIDALSFDIYDLMNNFNKSVLILHGNKDEIIPISYSEKTCNILKNSKLYKIKNGGHGFKGTTFVIAVRELLKFINNKTV